MHGGQCIDVALVGAVESYGRLGRLQLRSHVAAQIVVGGFPNARGVLVYKAVEFALKLFLIAAGEPGHGGPVDFAGLVQRYSKGFAAGINVLGRFVFFQRALMEYGGLRAPLRFRVVVFKGKQEGLVGISGKSAHVLYRRNSAEVLNKCVVAVIEGSHCFRDSRVRGIVELGLEYFPNRVPDMHHPTHAGLGVG